ncbi:hypothetical protein TVAG_228750 [Trichomonas vaginalis G3]|uniref:E2F/DP family winged-helix DNA-binding domain-containing protein n=1 Tax=Trichomonas vaginalis (strain ATCC PRA-98 / G3) TaxID=412133 RepID=A2DJ37_TRIV3|nr:winged helix DNA-binding domain family [Trichomonas vaginalis G3]EAY19612.1 hypothetical protein TVAG_228750 [Trichomonas vaginalis G3]KAI5515052.1 winged helix DNA-binding domain family [Trichomonas vaginalis G3]|eukprot:XP_001580598.1 hypothetical protein [Trichomonas vaginalis G3]
MNPTYPSNSAPYEESFQRGYGAIGNMERRPDFHQAVKCFIEYQESRIGQATSITVITERFRIKRRRLYDVLNVFESLGVCEKPGVDLFIWHGLRNLKSILINKYNEIIGSNKADISSLQPYDHSIGIQNLTVALIMFFYVTDIITIDLRVVAYIFAGGSNKFRMILCKLYQVVDILSTVGVIFRSQSVSVVTLAPDYFTLPKSVPVVSSVPDVLSVDFLLNKNPKISMINDSRAKYEFVLKKVQQLIQ